MSGHQDASGVEAHCSHEPGVARGSRGSHVLLFAESERRRTRPAPLLILDQDISARHLQRELLFALSGRPGVMLTYDSQGECSVRLLSNFKLTICEIVPNHPAVKQFSPAALDSILRTFRGRATHAATLRSFVADATQPLASSSRDPSPRPSKTKQAFAEECRVVLEQLGHWIAALEASFVLGMSGGASSNAVPGVPAAATPLLLRLELEQTYGGLLDHLYAFLPYVDSPTLLLNTMYSTIRSLRLTTDTASLNALVDIFIATAAPVWSMLAEWLQTGMPIPSSLTDSDDYSLSVSDEEKPLSDDFFIKRDRDVSWADEDFWEAGFIDGDEGWPLWLSHEGTREEIMECGKARGLLRSLGESTGGTAPWLPLRDALGWTPSLETTGTVDANSPGLGLAGPHPTLDIAQSVAAYLSPICQITQFHLRRVLEEDCGLQEHLEAIEGLTYMRSFEVMDDWAEWLFMQVRSRVLAKAQR